VSGEDRAKSREGSDGVRGCGTAEDGRGSEGFRRGGEDGVETSVEGDGREGVSSTPGGRVGGGGRREEVVLLRFRRLGSTEEDVGRRGGSTSFETLVLNLLPGRDGEGFLDWDGDESWSVGSEFEVDGGVEGSGFTSHPERPSEEVS